MYTPEEEKRLKKQKYYHEPLMPTVLDPRVNEWIQDHDVEQSKIQKIKEKVKEFVQGQEFLYYIEGNTEPVPGGPFKFLNSNGLSINYTTDDNQKQVKSVPFSINVMYGSEKYKQLSQVEQSLGGRIDFSVPYITNIQSILGNRKRKIDQTAGKHHKKSINHKKSKRMHKKTKKTKKTKRNRRHKKN